MSIDGTSNPADDHETPASTGDDGDRRAEQADGQQTGPDDDRDHRRAERLTCEEYADAMRTDGPPYPAGIPGCLPIPAWRPGRRAASARAGGGSGTGKSGNPVEMVTDRR
jgi:hypothetical protein